MYHSISTVNQGEGQRRNYFRPGYKAIYLASALALVVSITFHSDAGAQQVKELVNPITLTANDGLNVGRITSAIVDRDGFLWIAGSNGLQCYDGYGFRTFRRDDADSNSLLTNNIYEISYDENRHQLWLSTWATVGGLSVFDIATETFTNYRYDQNDPDGIHSNGLFWSYEDRFGTRWVGGGKGLARYARERDGFRRISFVSDSTESQSGPNWNMVRCYSQDLTNDSIIWLGTEAGLIRFNVSSENSKKIDLPARFMFDLEGISNIEALPDGRVLIALWDNGSVIFDPVQMTYQACKYDGNTILSRTPINMIKSLLNASDDHIWIETLQGLLLYNFTRDSLESSIVVENQVNVRFGPNAHDDHGRILDWNGNSIRIYDERRTNMRTYVRATPDNQRFIPRRVIQIDDNQILLASQFSEGLYRIDLSTEEWEVIPPPSDYFEQRSSFECWDILQIEPDIYLVLSTERIYQYTRGDNVLKQWKLDPGIRDAVFKRIIQAKDGTIWVGSHYQGLFRIDPATGETVNYYRELGHEGNPKSGAIWDMAIDRNDHVWIRQSGYSVYVPEVDSFYNFPYFYPDEKIVRHVESLATSRDSNVWIISTDNYGGVIGMTDADRPELGVVSVIDKSSGLKSIKPWRLTADKHGNAWISSNSGLEMISPENTFKLYPPWSFSRWSNEFIHILEDDRILAGFRRGFGLIDREKLAEDSTTIAPYIHSLMVFDRPKKTKLGPFESPSIELKPKENHFSFRISALNPRLFGQIEYQYKLDGIDADWVQPDNRDYVSYSNINGGVYRFVLRARRDKGEWSQPYVATFKMGIPWYQKWWAKGIGIIFIASILYAVYRFRLKQELMEQESRRLLELDAFKNKFYTNITHEFRTPLTVIDGMAEEIARHPERDPAKNVSLIKKNSKTLLGLIDQMLELSRLNAGKAKVSILQHEVIRQLRQQVEMFESFAQRSGIGLQFYSEEQTLFMDTDIKLLEQAVSNILSNAIKYTQEHGKILVVAKHENHSSEPLLHIQIRDSGHGIPAEELPHIFDRYHRVETMSDKPGSGIGLSLTREIIHLLGGKISVESIVGVGTTFHIYLPFRQEKRIADVQDAKESQILNAPPEMQDDDTAQILIIEDNFDVTEYLRAIISEQYHVVAAPNGNKGLELARELLPDLIVSDVMMPGIDGYQVCSRLKADSLTDHIPVILLTARVSIEDRLQGLSRGADAYLEKPFEREELMIRINNLLQLRERLQTKYSAALTSNTAPESEQEKTIHTFVRKVERFILDNLENDDFSIDLLASHVHFSRSQLHRKLKSMTGMSTSIYIRSVRLHKAKELLTDTDMNVTEVSYAVGFKSPAYFSQAFKDLFGSNPSSMTD